MLLTLNRKYSLNYNTIHIFIANELENCSRHVSYGMMEGSMSFADPLLGDGYEIDEMVRIVHVALLCAQKDPVDCQTMSGVIAFSNFESTSSLPDPKPPSDLINSGAVDFNVLIDICRSTK